jgi:transposase-like protein
MPRISAEKKAEIVRMYLENDGMTYKELSTYFGVSESFIGRTINAELQAGNGIKPDRRAKPEPPDWMAYVTPLHQHKCELELAVQHKQAELEAAKQELRDFTATLKQLMEDTV